MNAVDAAALSEKTIQREPAASAAHASGTATASDPHASRVNREGAGASARTNNASRAPAIRPSSRQNTLV